MKQLFPALILGLLIIGGQPSLALAQDNGCVQDFSCVCDFTTTNTIHNEAKSGNECQGFCGDDALYYETTGDVSFGTFDFSCRDASGNVIGEAGTVSAATALDEAPLPTVEAREPIFPILNVAIPGLDFENSVSYDPETGAMTSSILGLYVTALYRYLLGAAALIAVTLLMIAGVQYATAGGSQEKVSKAKDRVRDAIIGIVILLLAYDIAFLIDPNTVRFDSLSLRSIEGIDLIPPGGEDDRVRATVPLDGTAVPLTGSNILPPDDALLDPDALIALQAAATDFFNTYKRNIVITSAYRPLERQATLFYNNCIQTGGTCSVPTCNPAANSSVVTRTGGRFTLSGVLSGATSSSVIVNTIAQNSEHENCPHTSAVAVDAWCEGSGSYQTDPSCQQALIQTMTKHGFCRLTSEVWHFELNSKKVSTACTTGNSTIVYTTGSGTFSPGGDCQRWDFKFHRCVVRRPQ